MIYWIRGSIENMSEHQEVIAELGAAGVLAGVRWACESATRRTLETYSEADGHDAAWLGNTRFTLIRDRLDRVFGCERYALAIEGDGDGEPDLDVLHAELSAADLRAMPRLDPGTVRRADLHGSPGWAHGSRRFLLASGEFGRLDFIPWPSRSATKRLVALVPNPDSVQPSLFEGFALAEIGGLSMFEDADHQVDIENTYVLAHALDAFTGQLQLVFGRPRLNRGGGPAWHWREDLIVGPAVGTGSCGADDAPARADAAWVPDAPVRLRRDAGQASGQQ
jgi:hypothetical protein